MSTHSYTYGFVQHTRSGDIYAVMLDHNHIIAACGPITQQERREQPASNFNFDITGKDATTLATYDWRYTEDNRLPF